MLATKTSLIDAWPFRMAGHGTHCSCASVVQFCQREPALRAHEYCFSVVHATQLSAAAR